LAHGRKLRRLSPGHPHSASAFVANAQVRQWSGDSAAGAHRLCFGRLVLGLVSQLADPEEQAGPHSPGRRLAPPAF
ncbi:MAG: hypothetical protein ACRDQH_13780, partial [Pseudonocardiaceae bacterium]